MQRFPSGLVQCTLASHSQGICLQQQQFMCGIGHGWHAAGKTLTLTEFLQSLHLSQVKQLRNRVTAKTYKPPPMEKRRTSAAA